VFRRRARVSDLELRRERRAESRHGSVHRPRLGRQNSAPSWTNEEAWRVDREPLLQIGEADGEEPYLFRRLASATRLPDGRIALVEDGTREIRLFDSDGEFILAMGGQGEGPGEFGTFPIVRVALPDTLVAWDARSRRMSWFLDDGTLVKDRRMVSDLASVGFPVLGRNRAWRMADENVLVVENHSGGQGTPGGVSLAEMELHLALVLEFGERTVSVGSFPFQQSAVGDVNGEGVFALNPFRPWTRYVLASGPPALHLLVSSDREVRTVAIDGTPSRIVRLQVPRTPVTSGDVGRYRRDAVDNHILGPANPSSIQRAFDLLILPDSTPVFDRLLSDGHGTLYAKRWTREFDSLPATYEVIDPQGHWLGSIEIPEELGAIMEIGPDHLLTEWRDSLDVPYLRMYRIVKGGG